MDYEGAMIVSVYYEGALMLICDPETLARHGHYIDVPKGAVVHVNNGIVLRQDDVGTYYLPQVPDGRYTLRHGPYMGT